MSQEILPQELWLQIIDYLPAEDCKNLRLTSKSNAEAVAPSLFSTIHLSPNTRSFDRGRGIAQSQELSPLVHSVIYHIGILEDVHNGFEAFRDDIMRIHKPIGSTEVIIRDILWKYHCFLEEMDGQRDFETRDEFEEIKVICEDLTNLSAVTTVLDENDPFDPPQDYIGRRTGVKSACSAEGSHFSNLLNAAAGKHLTTVQGGSMSWRCLTRLTDQALLTMKTGVMTELSLELSNFEFVDLEDHDTERVLKALDDLLTASVSANDYVLQLDFDEVPCGDAPYDMSDRWLHPIPPVVFKHTWPSLRKLALQGIVASEDEIITFLAKHANSLRSLHLDDIALAMDVSVDSDDKKIVTRGSILRLFRRIHETLNLSSATISGVFTNRGNESWCVDLETENEDCLRVAIENWLCHKGAMPLPLELPEDTDHTKYSAPEGCWDDSWVWEPDLAS